MALVVLALASAPASAGPNSGGVIYVHNTGIAWTTDPLPPTPAPSCGDVVNYIPMGDQPGDVSETLIWKAYAAFPANSSPRLKTCGWGISYPSVGGGGVTVEHNDAQNLAVFYITSEGWPASGSEVGMSFTDGARTDLVSELWWFSGYAHAGLAGEPQVFSIVANSAPGNQVFGDDAFPANEDPITGYGSLGFGVAGYTPCPAGGPLPGACCFPNGDCEMLWSADCVTAGGLWMDGECMVGLCQPWGDGACCINSSCSVMLPASCWAAGGTWFGVAVPCEPNPCPNAVERKSWGQIKNNYR
jgi:hypothetical protein